MLLIYGTCITPPNWHVIEMHPAPFSRIYQVFGGEAWYRDDCTQFPLKSCHLYIFPTSKPYEICHNPQKPLNCMYLHVDFYPLVLHKVSEIDLSNNCYIQKLFELFQMDIKNNHVQSLSALCELFRIYLSQNHLLQEPASDIKTATDYIANHLSQNISLSQLSKLAGYHPEYFIRLFKKELGITPHQYLMNMRLKESQKLLSSNMKISAIAKSIGYADAKSFGKAFKNKFGVSPKQYHGGI